MVPSVLVEIDSIPLTVNGKLDRKSLPDPEFVNKDSYIAPSTELESKACEIFADVLGLDISDISADANFFRLGGNSILSIKLKQRLNQIEEFKDITVADIFTYNTVKGLVNKVSSEVDNYNLPSLASNNSHEIAIIGTSGVFTGTNTVDQLWSLLESNDEAIEFLNVDECRELGASEELLNNPNYAPVSGRVKEIDLFDPSFWGISPIEAKQLDPQIRKFIEHCWYVLEQSGYSQSRKQDIIGVFAGMGGSSYFYDHILHGELKDEINLWEASASNSKDALATKVAYLLGLTGPAHSVNTACSTGLVSIVDACDKLSVGKCNMALAGGVSLSLPDQVGYIYQEGMILSEDGHCKTFDADANGTTGGSGVGVVLLKRLDDAIKDKDNILGVIKGYATNNDGDRKSGYTAPSVVGQSECIISAQKMAGVDVNDIDYVECHGTATKLGDPIEVQALKEAFKHNGYNNENKKIILGAIKANIGHTDSAAGTAGLIKVTEMFKHDLIPGQPNFNKPNPELNIESTPFEISKDNNPWLSNKSKPRLAGVSSFGVGGTNAHVVVSDYYQEARQITNDDNQCYIIPITAKNRKSLLSYQKALANYLENNEVSLRDLAYTLTYRREHFNYRSSFVANSKEELIQSLNTKNNYTKIPREEDNTIIFMFPGQGNQYFGMAKELYDNDESFKEIINKTIEIADKYLDQDLKAVLFNNKEASELINQTEWSQICLFVIEYSLAKYLNTLGINADAYIGHSIGEYVAATLSGVFKLEDAIKLVIARGRCMQAMPEGSMLSINAEKEEIQNYIQQSNCEIAVINSIEDIVVSGESNDIDNLHALLRHKAIPSIKLNTSHGYHSRLMQEASDKFKEAFEGIQINKPKQITISNITGDISQDDITTPEYWQSQIRSTVEFAKGVERLSNKYNNKVTFIEVGPGKSLVSSVDKYKKYINNRNIHTIQLLPSYKQKAEWDIRSQQSIEAILWQSNLQKKINKSLKHSTNLITNLPTYQFDFQKCWINKLPKVIDQDELSILPEDKWYSTPQWTIIDDIKSAKFKLSSPLIFISNDSQKDLFKDITANPLFIKLDINNKDFIQNDNQITINPISEDHYRELSNHINNIENIVHISSYINNDVLEDNLSYGFYSLFLIKKYLLPVKLFKRLLILTSGLFNLSDNDYISASNGSMVGALRNINYENPDLNAQIIDIGYNNDLASILSTVSKEGYYKSESPIAIRFNKLWQERISKITLEDNKQLTINDKDTIFVTGGLGGVALSTALEISKHHNHIHFILSSRTDITKLKVTEYIQEKLNILELIKINNCSLEILAIDISDELSIKQLESRDIQGIIHTAGVEPLPIDKYSLSDVKEALKAKVYGINNILNILDISKLKFIAMTSSLASIMGDVNRFEYCASNSYLDYLVKDNKFNNINIISINWPGWLDIGMVRNHKKMDSNIKQNKLASLIEANGFDASTGSRIFYEAINNNVKQVVLSKLDIYKLNKRLFNNLGQDSKLDKKIYIAEESYTEKEKLIAETFADILGLSEISIYDDFFELGGNSILAIKLSHRLSKELDKHISVADIFASKTIDNIKSKLDIDKCLVRWEF
ncbi:type I polyketide synthase [Francisella sp. SYW-9]|uniref:type I polyketide synthase n=1 Tax=Francisella sp. SYW-9 TaxID=2610888 RepID=UPI00123D7EB4|nr:type I polyketide synthase [Francisella sp. SYW-9]